MAKFFHIIVPLRKQPEIKYTIELATDGIFPTMKVHTVVETYVYNIL
jgi:hypothetical protein